MEPTWKDLYEFIQQKIKDDGESFLDNKLYIEMIPLETEKHGYKVIKDHEEWSYVQPLWKIGNKINVLTTNFKNNRIVTLNINY